MSKLIAGFLMVFLWAIPAGAERHKAYRPGDKISIDMQFKTEFKLQSAYLGWQTFDALPARQNALKRGFGCPAQVDADGPKLTLLCTIPADVADGHYSLTSISVTVGGHLRKFSFWDDIPGEVEVDIAGGENASVPDLKSVKLTPEPKESKKPR